MRRAWSGNPSPAWAGQHQSVICTCRRYRVFFDRLVQRHVVMLSPAASVSGVKEDVIEGKTPEITIEQTRKLLASIKTTYKVKSGEVINVGGLRDRAILATLRFTACRAGAVTKLRLQDFQHDAEQ